MVIAHFDWLPIPGNVVAATEEIILRYTPRWPFADRAGLYPQWLVDLQTAGFTGIETFSFDVTVSYSHEAWVGRVRASAPIAGTLDADGVRACSTELTAMLHERPAFGQGATQECYHPSMASRHPRLGVERDPEVERALTLTEPLLDPAETRSAAAQIRALTLRGARAVLASAGSESQLQARLVERYGARPGRGSLLELDPPPGEPDPAGAAPASDALRWVRGE